MRQHCTDGGFRFYRWRAHTEALSEDSGPEALSTQGPYFALHVFYELLKHIAGELSANCCRTITMTRYRFSPFCSGSWSLRLSFVTHVRYNEPNRLFPFPHRLLHAASASGGWAMTFEEILDQAIAMLQRRGRVSYSTLKRQFQLDDAALEDLKQALLFAHPQIGDEAGRGLTWPGDTASGPAPATAPALVQAPAPLTYTPPYLAEKILTSRRALEGERKQITVLFADLKGSTELIRDLDPEAAQTLLDPAL